MAKVTRPDQIDHEVLRAFAERAAWIAEIEAAMEAVYDVLEFEADLFPEQYDEGQPDPPLVTAYSVVAMTHERFDSDLEADLIRWLERDPEHWGIVRLKIIDPGQKNPRQWKKKTPRWVIVFSTNAAIAHYYFDQYGRRINQPPD